MVARVRGRRGWEGPGGRGPALPRTAPPPSAGAAGRRCAGSPAAEPGWRWPHIHLCPGARRVLQHLICKSEALTWCPAQSLCYKRYLKVEGGPVDSTDRGLLLGEWLRRCVALKVFQKES